MGYWGREVILQPPGIKNIYVLICNCRRKHESFHPVWHLLTLSMIQRFCVYYSYLFIFCFLDTGTPECFHTSDLKLTGASTLSQTCQFHSTTRSVREQSAGYDGCTTSELCSALHYLMAQNGSKYLLFENVICHDDTATLLMMYNADNVQYCYIPTNNIFTRLFREILTANQNIYTYIFLLPLLL